MRIDYPVAIDNDYAIWRAFRNQSWREGDAVSVDARGIEAAADWDNLKSTETYVGYDRAQNFVSRGGADVDRTFEMEFLDAGVETFAFTFG